MKAPLKSFIYMPPSVRYQANGLLDQWRIINNHIDTMSLCFFPSTLLQERSDGVTELRGKAHKEETKHFVTSFTNEKHWFISPLLFSGLTSADTVVNMRKVTHQTISEELSKTVLLPCLFTLRPSAGSFHEPPRIKWTKVWGQRGSDGLQKEQSVLVAKDNVVKVQ